MSDSPGCVGGVDAARSVAAHDCEEYSPSLPGVQSPGVQELFLRLWDERRYREAGSLAFSVALTSGDSDRFVYLGRSGACFWKLGEYASAEAVMIAAHALRDSAPDVRSLGRHSNNYGLLCLSLNRPLEALGHYKEARRHYALLDDRALLATAFNNLGLAHAALDEFTEALGCLGLAEDIYEELEDGRKLVEVAHSRLLVRVRQSGGEIEDWAAAYRGGER